MTDDDEGLTEGLPGIDDRFRDDCLGDGIHGSCGLIEDDNTRLLDQNLCECDPLALSDGKGIGIGVEDLLDVLLGESDTQENLNGLDLCKLGRHLHSDACAQVLQDGIEGVEGVFLVKETDVGCGPSLSSESALGHVDPIITDLDLDASRCRRGHSCDHTGCRGLSCTGVTDQCEDLPLLDVK